MSEEARPRGGRPRDAGLTERILDEALRVIIAGGFAGMRIEQLATAVGCGKAAVYRRFSTPGELAAEAIARALPPAGVVDTGDVVTDLIAINQEITRGLAPDDERHASAGSLLSAMLAPEVRPHIWERYFAARRARAREIIARGKERGQISLDVDADDVIDALSGYSLYRSSMRGVELEDAHTRRIVQLLLGVSPDALPPM
ncbi:TetR/AcrR family transcriptional regulator [Microbacterium bovistercoris]|uniref:TetR/AcrR family transcriptional regulator n=1 Tax=Microbacterium bovistercoris TaxID=2293570 RepID=A0A371NQC5_9MICO|nr:TetR/AcrR family transcriptional regulator [Microbacterium bovistercoris]REJ04394.1 TetR/AcrR family transcriptional regulator [Microbacterium bovistercoris]